MFFLLFSSSFGFNLMMQRHFQAVPNLNFFLNIAARGQLSPSFNHTWAQTPSVCSITSVNMKCSSSSLFFFVFTVRGSFFVRASNSKTTDTFSLILWAFSQLKLRRQSMASRQDFLLFMFKENYGFSWNVADNVKMNLSEEYESFLKPGDAKFSFLKVIIFSDNQRETWHWQHISSYLSLYAPTYTQTFHSE